MFGFWQADLYESVQLRESNFGFSQIPLHEM